jgi:uroporphyrinogen-III decarboxylase
VFEKLLVPRYKKILDPVVNEGVPVFYHNCGRCEDLLPYMVELGVKVWDPAQPVNDLKAIKDRYGNELVINGGYEYDLPIRWEDVDEEEVRGTVRDAFEMLAPGGGYVFSGGVKSLDLNDPDVQRVNGWIRDEAEKLSETFYS